MKDAPSATKKTKILGNVVGFPFFIVSYVYVRVLSILLKNAAI